LKNGRRAPEEAVNSDVDKFLKKSKLWRNEIAKLRAIMLKTGLEESYKWNLPCYGSNGGNVAIIQPFKRCLGMMFFKGALLKDPKGVLIDNGPNSQAGRRFEFTSVDEIAKLAPVIRAYVKEAVALEKSGQKVKFKKKPQPVPKELKETFAKKPKFKKAFASLTPGRQRAYILHFSSAKQSATRLARIEKCVQRVLEGKGLAE
jgi:uncharacterized protein YdeI (YjbR/CyaY-like superfamily)